MIAEMPSTSTAMGQLLREGIGDAELHVSSSKMIDNLHGNATAAWRMVVTYRSASPTPPGVASGLRAICDRNRLRVQCQSALALTPAGWWLQHHLRVRRHDQRAASYAPTRASNWLSPPRRSRRGQCDGERVVAQHQ